MSSPNRPAGIGRAHQRLTDEHRVEPGGGHARPRRRALRIALSATAITSGGSCAASDSRDAEVLGERREVAAVDADDPGAGAERALELGRVVRLDQHAEPEAVGERVEVGEQRVVGQRGRRSAGSRRRRSRGPRTPGPRRS